MSIKSLLQIILFLLIILIIGGVYFLYFYTSSSENQMSLNKSLDNTTIKSTDSNISLDQDLIPNLSNLLNLYKKNKDIIFMNLAFFIVNYYFKDISSKSNLNIDNINDIKNFIFKSLNNFLIYNINHNTVINAVHNKLNHE